MLKVAQDEVKISQSKKNIRKLFQEHCDLLKQNIRRKKEEKQIMLSLLKVPHFN